MNTTLLLSCTLALTQPAADTSAPPEFEGTFSVLVKTTSLVGAVTPAGGAVIPAAPADVPPAPLEPAEDLTPVPPLNGEPPAEQVASASHVEQVPAASLSSAGVPEQTAVDGQTKPTERVLRGLLALPERGSLSGQGLSLHDALAGLSDRHAQLQVVSAYWQLVAAVGRYRAAFDLRDRLARLPDPADAAQAVRLQAARDAATATLRDNELSAVSMQYALQQLIPQRTATGPAYPTDPPFVGIYRTQFETLFAHRPTPAGMFRIHKILPLRLAAVDAHAAAVVSAEEAALLSDDAFLAGETSWGEVTRQLAAWQAQREAFLAAVRDYNIDIAAYALAVAVEPTDTSTLVSMLIGASPTAGSPRVASLGTTVRPQGNVDSNVSPTGPTLATNPPPWQTETRAAAQAVPVTVLPTTSPNVADPPATPPAVLSPEQSEAAPFRDVTPAAVPRPEVLVPASPARYRSVPVPTGTLAPAAGFVPSAAVPVTPTTGFEMSGPRYGG